MIVPDPMAAVISRVRAVADSKTAMVVTAILERQRESGVTLMLNGIMKAAAFIGFAVIADQFLADGVYTDATLSMLRQIEHSFH